jgi:tRNA threonylcarbamoyladenosine biosynthesis protein TsaB
VLPSGPFVRPLIPGANSLLELAPSLLAQGQSVAAHLAQPLYVRDKVAQTTTERLAAKAKGQA